MEAAFMMTITLLHERLDAAITNLSQRQKDRLAHELSERNQEAAGLRGTIAVLAGLPTTSVLSDMTAGRTPGQRHQAALARVLGISHEWLAGDDRHCPDWALEPLPAWERFAEQLTERWRLLAGRKASLDRSSGHLAADPADAQRIARLMELPLGHTIPSLLADGRFTTCDYDQLERFAVVVGLPEPTHPEHLRTGQTIARVVSVRVEQALALARRRYARFLLPPRLFSLTRLALVGLKAQRSHQGKTVQAVDDSLEVLWRQQLVRRGTDRRHLPESFTRETGRASWTPLAQMQARYPENDDPSAVYNSDG
jgi:hypothetical protein